MVGSRIATVVHSMTSMWTSEELHLVGRTIYRREMFGHSPREVMHEPISSTLV
jgi:hypothetical protein